VKVVAAEPAGAALLSGKTFAPHKIQGWTPDFIPGVLQVGDGRGDGAAHAPH